MNDIISKLLENLPDSPFELTKANIKKTQTRLPVPKDFKILWADISSLNGYPSGIVITDKALVYKAPKDAKKKDSSEDTDKDISQKEDKKLSIIYRITPWEYFDPTVFSIVFSKETGKYILYCDREVQTTFTSKDLYSFFSRCTDETLKERRRQEEVAESCVFSAADTIFFEDTEFHSAYGAGNSATGFGIYGEEVSAKLDRLHGEDSTVVGRDNAKNGPDKIVNGQGVQVKCYQNGASSVNACFDKTTKQFKYIDLNGKPMQVEVPADQYDDAVKQLQKKIEEGKVPGVNDPNDAFKILRKSKLTNKQIHNLAKAGTFESITYDAATGAVQCAAVCGLSALVSFGLCFWKTKDVKKSAKEAANTGIEVFGPVFATKMMVSQLARTSITRSLAGFTTQLTKSMSPKMRQAIVNALRALTGKTPIYGAAAQKSLAKALSANIIIQGATFAVYLIPNTVKLFSKKSSGAQYIKNLTSFSASMLGTAGASLGTGFLLGKVGKDFAKTKPGKALAFVGGTFGGTAAGFGARKVGNLIREDDSIITARMFQACLTNMCCDYLLQDDEMDALIELIGDKENQKKITKFQSTLLANENQYYATECLLKPFFEEIVSKRTKIDSEKQEEFLSEMCNSIVELTEREE